MLDRAPYDGSTPLKVRKRELFSQYVENGLDYASGGLPKPLSQAEAARRAGYSPKTAVQMGSQLLTFPDVRARVAYLRAVNDARFETYSRADGMRELEEARQMGLETRQTSAVVAAITRKLQLKGLLDDERMRSAEDNNAGSKMEVLQRAFEYREKLLQSIPLWEAKIAEELKKFGPQSMFVQTSQEQLAQNRANIEKLNILLQGERKLLEIPAGKR